MWEYFGIYSFGDSYCTSSTVVVPRNRGTTTRTGVRVDYVNVNRLNPRTV